MKHFIIICLLTLLGAHPVQAAERIPVTLDRVIDGDTLSVKQHGHKKTVRLLLVDTLESKKPNTPVQPYSLEAADYTKSLVSRCDLVLSMILKVVMTVINVNLSTCIAAIRWSMKCLCVKAMRVSVISTSRKTI